MLCSHLASAMGRARMHTRTAALALTRTGPCAARGRRARRSRVAHLQIQPKMSQLVRNCSTPMIIVEVLSPGKHARAQHGWVVAQRAGQRPGAAARERCSAARCSAARRRTLEPRNDGADAREEDVDNEDEQAPGLGLHLGHLLPAAHAVRESVGGAHSGTAAVARARVRRAPPTSPPISLT
jgi:hypothetical protein